MPKLNSYHLKLIALGTMFLDHALKLFTYDILEFILETNINPMTGYIIFLAILSIGRLSLPLYAFMIAEGCHYTSNIKKYISRLLILGVISEIPFQYMLSNFQEAPYKFGFSVENVFFTLALGAVSIAGYRYMKNKFTLSFLAYIPAIICSVASHFLMTDYEYFGVLLIFLFYVLRDSKLKYLLIVSFAIVLYPIYSLGPVIYTYGFDLLSVIEILFQTIFTCLTAVFIHNYNHERGKSIKSFFYFFYPIHLIILNCIYLFTH